ncbi:MAG: glycosyltransferase family 39 protein [Patescibacteria group bacterium]
MIRFIKNYYPLILIIILGVLLRFWGVFHDWPLSSAASGRDEINILTGSLKMLSNFSLVPRAADSGGGTYFPLMYYFYLPFLMVYAGILFILGQVHTLADIKNSVALNLGDWLLVGRFISIILGSFSIYLIYLIGQRLFDKKSVAYLAALFFALSPFNVALSHFGKIWTPQVFFILLAFYFFLRFWQDPNGRLSIKIVFFTALFVLLSFAVNLVGAIAYPLLLLIIFIYYCDFKWRKFFAFLTSRWSILLHLFLVIGVLVVFLITPDWFKSYDIIRRIFFTIDTGIPFYAQDSFWDLPWWGKTGLVLNILLQFETVAFLFLAPAFWFLYKQGKKNFYFLLFSLLGFFIVLSPPLMNTTRPRYLSLLTPFLIFPAAYLSNKLVTCFRQKRASLVFIFVFIAIIIAPALFIDLKYDYLLQKNSTKLELYSWLKNNLQPGEKALLVEYYFLQDLPPDKELISLIKEYSPSYYSTRLKYIDSGLAGDLRGYGLYSNGFICQWPKEVVEKIKFDYIIIAETKTPPSFDLANYHDFRLLDVCDSIPKYRLTTEQLVFSEDNSPYFNYSIDSGTPLESYYPLWQIKKIGKPVNIYKIK